MNYLDKKPFCLLDSISEKFLNILLKDIPYKFENQVKNKIQVSYEMSHNLIKDNWKKGVYMLNSNEIENLNENECISYLKNKLIKIHDIRNREVKLSNGSIFYPAKCKYFFQLDKQGYIYHKYHLDSGYKLKALIMLENSQNEFQQFSYISKFPESLLSYYFKRHFIGKLVCKLQIILYYISFKYIKLSGQPPQLPKKYQDPSLYQHFDELKRGQMISFHNLYPHSSHNGFSKHSTPMLQLVFDI